MSSLKQTVAVSNVDEWEPSADDALVLLGCKWQSCVRVSRRHARRCSSAMGGRGGQMMLGRQRDDRFAMQQRQRPRQDDQTDICFSRRGGDCTVNLARVSHADGSEL